MLKKASSFLILLILIPFFAFAETIDVHIKGMDDGVKTTKQQDYKEAVLFAKREAIERAGVKIKALTTAKDFVVHSDYIESEAEAILMPGYNIIDVGYQKDETYLVILIGKVNVKSSIVEQPAHHDEPKKDRQNVIQTWIIKQTNAGRPAELKVDSSGYFTGSGWGGNAPGCGSYDIPITNGSILNTSISFKINASYCNGSGNIQGSCSGKLDTYFSKAGSGAGKCFGTIKDPLGVREFNFPWTLEKVAGNRVHY